MVYMDYYHDITFVNILDYMIIIGYYYYYMIIIGWIFDCNILTMIIIGDSPPLSCLGFLHLVRFEDLLSLQDLKPTKPVGHQTWRNRLQ